MIHNQEFATELMVINYKGTMEQWNNVEKEENWSCNVSLDCVIHCKDGDLNINGEEI